ncbi:MAG: hypothetical protein KDA68_16365 [Planctomycetaceae bacterium]|nr:hypothetical protein [Planctomycetaceae bacterium]
MFGDQMGSCNWKGSRFLLLWGIVWLCGGVVWGETGTETKPPAKTTSKSATTTGKLATRKAKGTVTGVVQEGKRYIVKWQEPTVEGFPAPKELELLYSPKSNVLVKAPGSTVMLEQGAMVGAVLKEKEGGLSGHEFVVFLDTRQPPSVVKDPDLPNVYRAVGRLEGILGIQLSINYGSEGTKAITVDYEPTVTVHAVNPAFLKAGSEGMVEYLPSKEEGKPGMLVGIEVSRKDPFSEEELKGTNVTKGKGSVAAKSSTSRSPTAAKRGSKPVPKSGEKSSVRDPFGVLDK